MNKESQPISWIPVVLTVVASLLLIAVFVFFSGRQSTASEEGPVSSEVKLLEEVNDSDHVKGSPEAAIVIVEYSDFECPACRSASLVLKQVSDQYEDRVKFVYRHFPLSYHKNAAKAAEATEAVAVQGKFWEYHDLLFDKSPGSYSEESFITWAGGLGLDVDRFTQDLKSGKYAEDVTADLHSGRASGVQGTPAIFINGYEYRGPVTSQSLTQTLDEILNLNNEK